MHNYNFKYYRSKLKKKFLNMIPVIVFYMLSRTLQKFKDVQITFQKNKRKYVIFSVFWRTD